MCAPAFHFAAIMLKYKLEKVDVKMKRTESEESSIDFSALEKRRADTKINCARIDARCIKFQKWATKSMKRMRI